ncbi:MAG TPA: hypothetical protein VHF91_10195 [Acidimicrobiales bacterium]|nr:hypothetical protein [Acidimicrobiales bacterium]
MDGKADWMAYGLPVEGDDGPFLGSQLNDVPTCDVDLTVGDARTALTGDQGEPLVLLAEGLVVGEVDAERLAGRGDDEPLLDVLDPVPTTVRPSVTVRALAEKGGGRRLVTTSDGRLLGQAMVEAAEDDGHEGHDGHEHGEMERYEDELAEIMAGIEERFGDREPSEDELRAFLRDRLVAEGRSPEDADRFLDQLGTGDEG